MATKYTSAYATSGNSNIEFRIKVVEESQGIVNGTPQSVINASLQTRRRSSGTTTYKQSTACTMTINGTQYSKTINYNVGSYTVDTWYTIWTKSNLTINHSSDGTKTMTVAFSANLSNTSVGSTSHTWTNGITLTAIPMGSTLTLDALNGNYYIADATGPTATAFINRYNNSYYHQLVWKFGSTTVYTQNAGQVASATKVLAAADWLPLMPNSATGSCSCTLKTFSDSGYSTQVGVDSKVSFTITCTRDPSIGTVTAATGTGSSIPGAWIGGYTTAKITASSCAGINSSTITKYEFLQNGVVKATYESSAASYEWTSELLTAGSYNFRVRVTDSRGRTAYKETTVTVLAYMAPGISSVTVFRCDSGGTAAEQGTYISVKGTATATPTGNSISSFKVYTKQSNSSTWTDKGNLTNGTASVISSYAYTSTWDVKLQATDAIGKTTTLTVSVPTAAYTMDFKVGGLGVAFGKVAETDNLLDSAWKIKAPYMEVGGTDVPYFPKFIVNSSGKTITFSNGYRGIMFVTDSTTANCGVYIIATTGAGAVMRSDIKAASDLTFSTGTGTLTMTITSGTRNVLMINVNGTVTQ